MKPESRVAPPSTETSAVRPESARSALMASVLGFFVITLDAVVVNVALPSIRSDVGGGMTGQQWIVDGYTLAFAALLLSAGALSDRLGARRSFSVGLGVFVAASLACGLAPGLGALIAARVVQGGAAAVMMPASMALIGHGFPDPVRRARAVAVWAMGGAVASTSGPVLGGLLNLLSWRLIFLINLPVGIVGLILLVHAHRSPRRQVPFDWAGQTTAVLAMGGMTYGIIEAGAVGPTAPQVVASLAVGLAALVAFAVAQSRGRHPMVPPTLVRSRVVAVACASGFAFMIGNYGVPFVMTLYLQQHRGLTSLGTGIAFLPMMLIGFILTPFVARIVERIGARRLIPLGFLSLAAGLIALAVLPSDAPIPVISGLLVLVGLCGPLVIPPISGVLLNSVPAHLSGTASGVFHTSRQVGGALAVAVFGALLADAANFSAGVTWSLLAAAAVALCAAVASRALKASRTP